MTGTSGHHVTKEHLTTQIDTNLLRYCKIRIRQDLCDCSSRRRKHRATFKLGQSKICDKIFEFRQLLLTETENAVISVN